MCAYKSADRKVRIKNDGKSHKLTVRENGFRKIYVVEET